MKNTRALARLGMLALGLALGGGLGSIPATASADSSDWLAGIDGSLVDLATPADSLDSLFPDLDVAISFNGMSLFQDGSATASSGTIGSNDFAIAYGANSSATVTGSGSYAVVYGSDSHVTAGGEGASGNSAFVLGDDSSAVAGGANSSGNAAAVYGLDSHAVAGGVGDNPGNMNIAAVLGDHGTALAGSSSSAAGSYDIGYVEGNNVGIADATGDSNLVDIDKFYDNWGIPTAPTFASAAASTPSSELLSGSDPSGALADGNTFWTDLFSGDTAGALTAGQDFWADLGSSFDPAGAAADSSNAWTELISSFDGAGAAADASNFWTELAALF
jgi:hypothetical protein